MTHGAGDLKARLAKLHDHAQVEHDQAQQAAAEAADQLQAERAARDAEQQGAGDGAAGDA